MPTVHRFDRFRICIYADDHPPPHFHVEGKGFRATILIGTLSLDVGQLPPGILAEARAWASINLEALRSAWEELNGRG